VGGAIEAGVLILLCLAPWAFGATAPKYVFFLDVGLAGLMVLWGARVLLEGRLTWRKCPVAACLGALVLVAAWQLVPLPGGLLRGISPATARMYDRLLPARPEVLPAGEPRDNPVPSRRLDAQRRSRRHAQGAGKASGRADALRGRTQQRRSGRRPEAPGDGRPDQRIAPGHLRADPGVLIGPANHLLGLSDDREPVRPFHQSEPLRVLHEPVHRTQYWPAHRPACGARRARLGT